MSKLIKLLISIAVAILVFFIGVGVVMAVGIIGIAAMIVPAVLAFVAFVALQMVFRVFRLKTLLFVAIIWFVVTSIGAGAFSFFA